METVYEHIKGADVFTVTAAEQWSIWMLKKLKKKYPNQVEIAHVNSDGSMVAHIPFEWMRIVPKRVSNMTEEQKKLVGERLRSGKVKANK